MHPKYYIENEEAIVFYNKASGKKLGWGPMWFDETTWGPKLISKIVEFQLKNQLKPDGMCGPGTFRVLKTERDAEEDDDTAILNRDDYSEHIIYCGEKIAIDWPKVVLWHEDDGLKAKAGCYRSKDEKRDIKMFVNHWDVCLSSSRCMRVLNDRGISVQFLIDNDGTIYQTMDMNEVAWHAGGRTWNNESVGVEITNAYYKKHQQWYMKQGHGQRPYWYGNVHGKHYGPFLGFYDVQLQALKALWRAIEGATSVEWQCPKDPTGGVWTTVSPEASSGSYRGIVSHYHLKKSKIDCVGLDIPTLIDEAKDGK